MSLTPLVLQANALALPLADRSVHCVVTSPPYWNLRDYGVEGQLGLEPTPEAYVANMVAVFREVRRVLRDDGTLWLNIGDSYAGSGRGGYAGGKTGLQGGLETQDQSRQAKRAAVFHQPAVAAGAIGRAWTPPPAGLKRKDLVGIPWMLAFALRADGWYLRQEVIWHKPNPMPSSVRDRCTTAHEPLFLLTKRPEYYFDAEAIAETAVGAGSGRESVKRGGFNGKNDRPEHARPGSFRAVTETRNKRSVWTISTESCREAHFATYPSRLVEPCILAGTSARGCCPDCGAGWVRVVDRQRVPTRPGVDTKCTLHSDGDTATAEANGWNRPNVIGNRDPQRHVAVKVGETWVPGCKCGIAETVPAVVFDVFHGAGTTGIVADRLGRQYVGTELNPDYLPIFRRRLEADRAKRLEGRKRVRRKREEATAPRETGTPSLFDVLAA